MRTDCCKPNGKRAIVFSEPPRKGTWELVFLPCGQCIGCRLKRSRDWAIRCVHEMKMHNQNCYLTLTYDDNHVPWSNVTGEQTLFQKHLTDFLKRLRYYLKDVKIRYFACGEYGDETFRPHYHVIIFGWRPDDIVFYKPSKDGFYYYFSEFLDSVWTHGRVIVADATYETCAYVARYVTKKLNGDAGKEKYEGIQPEFVTMSRRPGIGLEWFKKFYKDIYPYDEVIVNGRSHSAPRYYDEKFSEIDANVLDAIKSKRIEKANRTFDENYGDYFNLGSHRLERRELYQLNKTKEFKRSAY